MNNKTTGSTRRGPDYLDLLMVALATALLGVAASRLIPELTDVSPWWWMTLSILLILRPIYRAI